MEPAFDQMRFRGLLLSLLLTLSALPAFGQQIAPAMAPDSATTFRIGLELIPPPFTIEFPGAPGLNVLWLRPRFTDWLRDWQRAADTKLALSRAELLRRAAPIGRAPLILEAPSF